LGVELTAFYGFFMSLKFEVDRHWLRTLKFCARLLVFEFLFGGEVTM
jgi:hypothetical protein